MDIKERLAALRDEDRVYYATYPMSVTSVCTDALAALAERDQVIVNLTNQSHEHHRHMVMAGDELAERDERIALLEQKYDTDSSLKAADMIEELNATIRERDERIASLQTNTGIMVESALDTVTKDNERLRIELSAVREQMQGDATRRQELADALEKAPGFANSSRGFDGVVTWLNGKVLEDSLCSKLLAYLRESYTSKGDAT